MGAIPVTVVAKGAFFQDPQRLLTVPQTGVFGAGLLLAHLHNRASLETYAALCADLLVLSFGVECVDIGTVFHLIPPLYIHITGPPKLLVSSQTPLVWVVIYKQILTVCGGTALILAISISPMSNGDNVYEFLAIIDCIEYSIVAYTNAPQIFLSLEFPTAAWAWNVA